MTFKREKSEETRRSGKCARLKIRTLGAFYKPWWTYENDGLSVSQLVLIAIRVSVIVTCVVQFKHLSLSQLMCSTIQTLITFTANRIIPVRYKTQTHWKQQGDLFFMKCHVISATEFYTEKRTHTLNSNSIDNNTIINVYVMWLYCHI